MASKQSVAQCGGVRKSVYQGVFIHLSAQKELEILGNAVVGVDEQGRVMFVEKAEGESEEEELKAWVKEKLGWDEVAVVKAKEKGVGFWFPGFIGMWVRRVFRLVQ